MNVEELWMLECVQHGDAGLLNEGLLGDTCTHPQLWYATVEIPMLIGIS